MFKDDLGRLDEAEAPIVRGENFWLHAHVNLLTLLVPLSDNLLCSVISTSPGLKDNDSLTVWKPVKARKKTAMNAPAARGFAVLPILPIGFRIKT